MLLSQTLELEETSVKLGKCCQEKTTTILFIIKLIGTRAEIKRFQKPHTLQQKLHAVKNIPRIDIDSNGFLSR